ncbi:pro-neuregulin-4, membrane-bound isoform [Protopterus annectens]|uniref:pro-neuregulin-4, membrane-bound isoform n=1 Tax=Protopterus annectens TaxID=7888 RepID=UPI001CFB2F0A|nr:pro-neuregulin-4, membrane-bound isoform [Protopterus annectens]XP_043932046.1 pro-neuregulin-4, membrane-bound isoform [Protopterus annectens]
MEAVSNHTHEVPCEENYSTYCLNSGICYRLATVTEPFCRCRDEYKGSRCEEFLLNFVLNGEDNETGLLAAFIVVAILTVVLVAGATVYYYRAWKKMKRNNSNGTPYHHVAGTIPDTRIV